QRARRFCAYIVVAAACLSWLYFGGASQFVASRARSALARHDIESAREWLQFADRLNDRQPEIAFLKARAARKDADFEGALKHLNLAQELGWDNELLRREEILLFAQAGLMRQSEPLLKELLLRPGDDGSEICEAFVSGFLLDNNHQKAMMVINAWIGDFPEAAQPWIFKGEIGLLGSQYRAAQLDFEQALKRDPEASGALAGLGTALLLQNRPGEALVKFRRCLELHPDVYSVRKDAANALVALGRSEEAEMELNHALAAAPDYEEALLARGKLRLSAGRADAAVKDFESLCRLRKRGFEHRYQIAMALRAAGRQNDAVEHFRFAEKAKAELNWAEQVQKDEDKKNGISESTLDLKTRTKIGLTYLAYGNPITGVSWLRAILNEEPKNRMAIEALAQFYREKSEHDQSFAHLAEQYEAARDSLDPK
ncbi:MAG: tetratricopeptide repeat protein, partial [Planctomycetota bacterium]|nr:tetratricopeptide repeat protein [Planctomycetota bacterium]